MGEILYENKHPFQAFGYYSWTYRVKLSVLCMWKLHQEYCLFCLQFIGLLINLFCIFKVITLFSTKIDAKPTHAEYLGVSVRPNSNYEEGFYYCNSCGVSIQWMVNDIIVATNYYAEIVGSVNSQTRSDDATALNYASTILSKHSNDSEMCMDVVLIIIFFQGNLTEDIQLPRVACLGTRDAEDFDVVEYPSSLSDNQSIKNGTVELELSVNQRNIVVPGSNSVTRILTCNSNETKQIWFIDKDSVAGFNGNQIAGNHEFALHPDSSTVAIQEAILLVKRPEEIRSVLILTTLNNTTPLQVTCVSNSNYASTMVQEPPLILSTELITPNSESNLTETDSPNATAARHRMNVDGLLLTVSLVVVSYVL